MRTHQSIHRQLGRLLRAVRSLTPDIEVSLMVEGQHAMAKEFDEHARNFVFSLRDARKVLKAKGGAA